jgi:hypothetical protein
VDQASESNLVFLDAWDALTAGCPRRESRRGGLVEVSWGGVPVVFFNLAVASRTPTSFGEFEAAVADTCSWAAERVHPWLFAVCHETLGDLLPAVEPLMARHGLAPMMPLTGMAAQQIEGTQDVATEY